MNKSEIRLHLLAAQENCARAFLQARKETGSWPPKSAHMVKESEEIAFRPIFDGEDPDEFRSELLNNMQQNLTVSLEEFRNHMQEDQLHPLEHAIGECVRSINRAIVALDSTR